ncbi:MAG: hypothetical protein QM813_24475 [Verrucomicrobiota bacterium]
MNTTIIRQNKQRTGYALVTVLVVCAVSLLIVAVAVKRTATVASLNKRNNLYVDCQNAAEAATEKVIARMSYDFHANGLATVIYNLNTYRTYVPTTTEDTQWAKFSFSDGTTTNRVSVEKVTEYTGPMPSQFPGLNTMAGPVYRIRCTATKTEAGSTVSASVQQDLLLALIPLPQWAIFANNLLEFSTCATMEVRGRVHANAPIYVGTGSGSSGSATLTFFDAVTTVGTLNAPNNAGYSWGSDWNTSFSTPYITNRPTVSLNFNMTNAHSFIEIPSSSVTPTSTEGKQLVYNNAQIVLLVDDAGVSVRLQSPDSAGNVAGADPYPVILTNTLAKATNFSFLNVTNRFTDQREASKTVLTTQIDVAKYATWLTTNSSVQTKFSGIYPTVLYVADKRTVTSAQMTGVRLINGTTLPSNGGAGFSVATPNPLYVVGNYNVTNSIHLATTNTSSTVPAALMSDALTILSSSWKDADSSKSYSSRSASSSTTINACVLTGMVPSTGTSQSTFGGGIHNLPRMLEDWGSSSLWLNTSLLYLFTSKTATNKFIYPGLSGPYYNPPTRKFSYDLNFNRLDRQPPGIPTALVAARISWSPK